ncbi:mediator of RNA polymerase II transcription subunit 8 [Naviculisporaceae sp. PSN 640]
MASLNLAPEELKQLELMRNRFQQLSSTLNTLMRDVYHSDPLPSGESIQTSATILQQTVKSIQDLTNENAHLLQRLVIHPSTNYPGRTQEGPLLTLLRKKPDPEVEHWAEDAREAARAAGIDVFKLKPRADGGANAGLDEEDEDAYGYDPDAQGDSDIFNEQWADIRESCSQGIVDYIQNQANEPYTAAERAMGTQFVRTGLKRSLEEIDEDEEESDEEDSQERMDEDVVEIPKPGGASRPQQPAAAAVNDANKLHPEHMLWFMAKGDMNIPTNLDMEYLRRSAKETGKRAAPTR